MDVRCTVYALLLWLIFIDFCSNYANAELIVKPKDTVVLVNQPTYFNCSTSVRNISASFVVWYHYPSESLSRSDVYDEGQIIHGYNDRFRTETNVAEGVFNLVVERPSLADAGRYECQDGVGQGDKASAELIVLDVTPSCESNINTVGVIGQNDCGLEPDEIQLICRVTSYHGNIPPTLEWKISGDESRSSLVVRERTASCKLTLKANLTFNNQSFVCQITNARRQQYGCSIGPMKVKYALRSGANRATEEDVMCMANSSQHCSYKWYNAKDETVSSDENLKKQKPGQYKCKALCEMNRGNDQCEFIAMEVEIILSSDRSIFLVLLLLNLVFIIVIAICCFYIRHKSKTKLDNPTLGCNLFRQNTSSTGNVARQSTDDYEEINELNMMIKSPITNPAQSAGYSGLILEEDIRQQAYDTISHQESSEEINEKQNIYSAVDEYKYNVIVHADDSHEICAHSSDDEDGRHNESISNHEEPHCEPEIPSEYLTIII